MKNVTLSVEDSTLEGVKRLAASRGVSLNAYIRGILQQLVRSEPGKLTSVFEEIDKLELKPYTYRRSDAYED